jgi:magnesium-transporting ATPase (P-type)
MEEIEYTTMEEDMPVSDTLTNDELMSTSQDIGVEYMSTLGDVPEAASLTGAEAAGVMAMLGIWLAVVAVLALISLVAMWKIFTKMGLAGWKSLIPFYNLYVMLPLLGRPGWWLILFFVPFVNIAIAVIFALDLAKSFGRSAAFGVVALFLFSLIGYPMLAFGKDVYVGPGGAQATPDVAAPTPDVAAPAA